MEAEYKRVRQTGSSSFPVVRKSHPGTSLFLCQQPAQKREMRIAVAIDKYSHALDICLNYYTDYCT